MFAILEESETIIKYKEGNKLVGFCGYSKNSSTKYKLRKMFYKLIKNKLYKSKSIKNYKAFKQYEIVVKNIELDKLENVEQEKAFIYEKIL